MNNTLSDLNNHLFAQMERLGDEELSMEVLSVEIERGKAISNIAAKIIDNGRLALDASKLAAEYGGVDTLPQMLIEKKENK